jgi:hypothetical protein
MHFRSAGLVGEFSDAEPGSLRKSNEEEASGSDGISDSENVNENKNENNKTIERRKS